MTTKVILCRTEIGLTYRLNRCKTTSRHNPQQPNSSNHNSFCFSHLAVALKSGKSLIKNQYRIKLKFNFYVHKHYNATPNSFFICFFPTLPTFRLLSAVLMYIHFPTHSSLHRYSIKKSKCQKGNVWRG